MATVTDAARELYGLVPAEFTAARNALAQQAADGGDRELAARIRKLPKPPVAAWAVNALVRHRPDEVDAVLDLGERMRTATAQLDRPALQELGRERHRLLAGLGRAARELGEELGVGVSEAAATEVQQSFQAALADPAATAAVRSGLLVRTLASDGLSAPELAGAMAVSVAGLAPLAAGAAGKAGDAGERGVSDDGSAADRARRGGSADGGSEGGGPGGGGSGPVSADEKAEARRRAQEEARERALAAARREAEETRQDAEDAEAELATLDLRIRDNREEHERLAAELRDLKQQVEDAHDALAAATSAAAALRRERQSTKRAADAAARAAARSRQALDRLT